MLPEDTRMAVRAALKQYLGFIETDDWPAMARGGANLRRIPLGLADAMKALISFRPVAPEQRPAQERAVIAIGQAPQAKRERIPARQATNCPTHVAVNFFSPGR